MITLEKSGKSKNRIKFSPSGDGTEAYSTIYVEPDTPLGKAGKEDYYSVRELKTLSAKKLGELVDKTIKYQKPKESE